IDEELLDELASSHELIVTLEENVASGGFGRAVCQYLNNGNKSNYVLNISLPDDYVEHGSVSILMRDAGIDVDSVYDRIIAVWRSIINNE
ncbi:MAG: transketolase C-terminal domain-containing protein, partial [Lachnospira sp.]